jgi:hypothetical protein
MIDRDVHSAGDEEGIDANLPNKKMADTNTVFMTEKQLRPN